MVALLLGICMGTAEGAMAWADDTIGDAAVAREKAFVEHSGEG